MLFFFQNRIIKDKWLFLICKFGVFKRMIWYFEGNLNPWFTCKSVSGANRDLDLYLWLFVWCEQENKMWTRQFGFVLDYFFVVSSNFTSAGCLATKKKSSTITPPNNWKLTFLCRLNKGNIYEVLVGGKMLSLLNRVRPPPVFILYAKLS